MASAKGRKDEISAVTANELRSQLVLKKMVGKGGFAAVYFGTYKGQEVAVKVILSEHVSVDSLQVKLLLREGQYMSRCTHKNIVKCHAVCQLPADFPGIEALGHRSSTWALVLEYIGGGSLAALMMKQMSQTRRAYTDYEAYCWVRDVAEALSYLHNAPRPVMHRDVKADNVLLTQDDAGRPTAKIMDFGLMAALDGKNPLLRRRSISATSGEGALGRTSAASIGRASVGAGGGRNLSAPSVATYYNDSTHEPGKIFYLMEELPAPTVAALAGPATLRRVSLDFGALSAAAAAAANGNLATAAAAAAAVASPPGGAPTPGAIISPNSHFGVITVASRGGSFDAAGSPASAGSPAGGGGGGGGGSAPWGSKSRGGGSAGGGSGSSLAPALQGSFGTLVPLSEEASYHGNTAGYAAMLMQQQQQRRQLQQQRRAAQDAAAAATAAAVAAGGSMGKAAAGASSSLPSSLHGGTRPGSCSGASPPTGTSPSGGVSPLPGTSPAMSARFQGDGLTPGSVRLRMMTDDGGGGGGGGSGGGDSAIAIAAARLCLHVSEKNGSFVRMSAPQPSAATPPATSPVLLEDDSPAADDPRESSAAATATAAATGGSASTAPKPLDDPQLPTPPSQQLQQLRASRPSSSASKLPPIIAVAKQPRPSIDAGADVRTPSATASGAAAGDSTALPAWEQRAGSATGYVSCGERRASLHDAVPVVGGAESRADGPMAAAGLGRRSRSAAPSTPPPSLPTAPLNSLHAQVMALGLSAADSPAGGGGGGGCVAAVPAAASVPSIDRQCSQKSIGSNRSETGNGHVNGGDGGTMAAGGAGAQFSIASLLQGRYEHDFQWVWRLTGQTGSCMYMAPEVFRNMPYNEKVDVFSFGVLMYEVFSRTLLLVSALNMRELRLKGMDTPEGYAQYVAEGYRPPKPLAMPVAVYELISACWADDPCARPNMADVVETLRLLQERFAPQPMSSSPVCGCAIS